MPDKIEDRMTGDDGEDSKTACEMLTRVCERNGCEALEKHFMSPSGEMLVCVVVVVGVQNAQGFYDAFNAWAVNNKWKSEQE